MEEQRTVHYKINENECREWVFGKMVSIELELFLASEQTEWDKEYLIKTILADWEKKNTRKIYMSSRTVE
jgi:hypothetical protein